jgi:hypothetical protein
MDERSLPTQRRFVAECAGMAVPALVWLACLVLIGLPFAARSPVAAETAAATD